MMINKHFSDGTTWPIPGEEMDELEHSLRYGVFGIGEPLLITAAQRYEVASIISAYGSLILKTDRRRREVVRNIRREMGVLR